MANKSIINAFEQFWFYVIALVKTKADISILDNKQDKITIITAIAENNLMLNDNTEYYLTDISSLTFAYPENSFEAWMKISFSSTENIDITFPEETQYIGEVPTFSNGETWEISIKDGVVVCWRVE